jgi:hypothetical protein
MPLELCICVLPGHGHDTISMAAYLCDLPRFFPPLLSCRILLALPLRWTRNVETCVYAACCLIDAGDGVR